MGKVLLEVCVDSVESAKEAAKGGAGRIELCSALSEGGLTPTVGLLKIVKRTIEPKIPVFVMLRPRRADFCFSPEEIEVILLDMEVLRENGADGFVFGALTAEGSIDVINCRRVIEAAGNLPVTFHRAFDVTNEVDSEKTCTEIADLGFKRLLTSGFQASAEAGLKQIKKLNEMFHERLIIMPGAGINERNVKKIADECKCREIHASARIPKNQLTTSGISMGGGTADLQPLMVTSSGVVGKMIEILGM
ncbi:copper homeostasis protein cutC homolog [Phlebotomus papatasi]|uniref:copper homeostasis protein cutC homolog n=1 Tax=Phlebotomus papatasi TaxID=29031 RepID=UPI00248427F3|nr:copper homeostasis protein cutC homolog [Phlebotomus papatasi]